MKSNFLRLLLIFVPVFSLTIGAQDLDDVSIGGKVFDSNRASIAGATVTATFIATGDERTVTADAEGRYRFVELPPGTYAVKASMTGFAAQEKTDLVTVGGQNVRLDFDLAPAAVAAEQIVAIESDDAPAVDPSRTIVGGTITERELEELPNNTRNPLDLVLILGGVSEEALSTRDLAEDRNTNHRSTPFEQGNFSLSGGAAYSNNITIDGLDNNDDRSSRDRFQPPIDSIAEVQVITNQFSAEYGRASGGRINLRTKAGANEFRGRAFMYFRDDNLNSNTWYNKLTVFSADGSIARRPLERLPLTEYNPGFTLSGPLFFPYYNGKIKPFFSFAYEHLDLSDTTLIDTYLPVGGNPRFRLPQPTGNSRTCDANPPIESNQACAGASPTAGYVSPYNFSLPTPNRSNVFTTRIDHKLFKDNDATFGWQFGRKKNKRTGGASTTRIENALQTRNNDTDALNFTDNHVFGSKTVNQYRMQWSRYKPSYQTDNPLDPVVFISYRNPLLNSAQTLIAGNSTGSSLQNFADSRTETRWQFQDSLTHIIGGHTLKTGFDVQKVDSRAASLEDATGTYNFGSVKAFTDNVLSRYHQVFGAASDVKNTYWGAFINHEAKLFSNLTLSYGLRYERETAVSDDDNFGPRLGIAWSPFKDGKGVIRFGTGIFYNRTLLRTVGDFIQNSAGGLFQFDSSAIPTTNNARNNVLARIADGFPNSYANVEALKNVIAAANCGTPAVPIACDRNLGFIDNRGSTGNPLRSVDPDLKIPESYQFNVGFEREIGKGFVFEANYTWNKTAHLWREYNINAPVLPAGYADWTAYLLANDFAFTNFNNTIRTYRFYLGSTTDTGGTASTQGGAGACSTTANATCWVNLNSISTSTTVPNTNAGDGVSSNSVGGPVPIAVEAIRRFQPDPGTDERQRVASIGNSFYHGLTLQLRSRFRKFGGGFGGSFRGVYTLSKLMDDGLNNTTNAEINADFSREWTRGLQDRRHRFNFYATLELPRRLGALRLSPLFRYGSSAPYNISIVQDRNLNGVGGDRVNYSGDIEDIIWREPGSPFPTALANRFSLQPIGAAAGNLPRNAGNGPGYCLFDMNVTREFKLNERFKLRPSVEIDNVFNMTVFSFGSEFINFNSLGNNATVAQQTTYNNFLVTTRTYRPREIRIGLRLDF
ncbi:MAG TPA: carboxypeptidase regulatory-like domain-containing protein [Pyrinomonadaceae bacterium]